MYVCPCCNSPDGVVGFFPAVARRKYDPATDEWYNEELANETEREPIRIECQDCGSIASDVDEWIVSEYTERKCDGCGNPSASEGTGYCSFCEDYNN